MANLNVPAAVGVPDSSPLDGSSVSPSGNAPVATSNVYDPVPPVAESGWLYAVPTAPFARFELFGSRVIVAQSIVRL